MPTIAFETSYSTGKSHVYVQQKTGLLAGLIVVGRAPCVSLNDHPATHRNPVPAGALPRYPRVACKRAAVMQSQLSVITVEAIEQSARCWLAGEPVCEGESPRRDKPSVAPADALVWHSRCHPRQALPNRVVEPQSRNPRRWRTACCQPCFSTWRSDHSAIEYRRRSASHPDPDEANRIAVARRDRPILPDRMAAGSSQPLGAEFVPKRNLSLGQTPAAVPAGSAAVDRAERRHADKRPTTSSVVRRSISSQSPNQIP
jgi:hypothetical protein